MMMHSHKEDYIVTPAEEKKRRGNLKYVINSMGLEGVLLDKSTLNNFEKYARGELTEESFIKYGLEIARSIDKSRCPLHAKKQCPLYTKNNSNMEYIFHISSANR